MTDHSEIPQYLRKPETPKINRAGDVLTALTMAAAATMAVSAVQSAGRAARDANLQAIGIEVKVVDGEERKSDFEWPSLATREVGN